MRHVFNIEVEYVSLADSYEDALKDAIEFADRIYNEVGDDEHILVRNGEELESAPEPGGVFCAGCEGHVFAGIRWPTRTNDDASQEWVERCDQCERYASDDEAADALLNIYGPSSAIKGEAVPAGMTTPHPYVYNL